MATRSYIDPEVLGRIAEVFAQRGYASVPNTAKALDIHPQTLHAYIKAGWVRTICVGKRLCITFDEFKRYKEEGNWDPSKYPAEPAE